MIYEVYARMLKSQLKGTAYFPTVLISSEFRPLQFSKSHYFLDIMTRICHSCISFLHVDYHAACSYWVIFEQLQ